MFIVESSLHNDEGRYHLIDKQTVDQISIKETTISPDSCNNAVFLQLNEYGKANIPCLWHMSTIDSGS